MGRIDISTAVMTISEFRASPRKGHLNWLKRMYVYLSKMRHSTTHIRTNIPDYSDIPDFDYDWLYSVYGNVEELIPDDIPEPLGHNVVLTSYVDANLYHDMITGHSVTGILHLINVIHMISAQRNRVPWRQLLMEQNLWHHILQLTIL